MSEQILPGYCPPQTTIAEPAEVIGSNPAKAPDPLTVLRGSVQRFIASMVSRSGNKAVFDHDDVLLLQEACGP